MIGNKYPKRIVNVRYMVNGLHFDAAIDCNWQLHAYGESPAEMNHRVPIELYCFDHKEWDIRMLYQDLPNNQPTRPDEYYLLHTEVNWEEIIKETEEWIKEELGQISEPKKPENNEKDIRTLF